MTPALATRDVERFRGIVAERLGLEFEDAKLASLAEVLARMLEADGRPCPVYLEQLEAKETSDELRAALPELTVAETYFFRHAEQFRAFTEVVLVDRMRARASEKKLRILSAGSATGEEIYTLAILTRETVLDAAWEVSLLGVDVNPAVLEKARRGRFSSWALRETSSEMRERWFRADARDFVLDPGIRDSVAFEVRNLAEENPGLWQHEAYDVIFCRNVMMYFTRQTREKLVARFARSLAPGGYLFLGHAETLRGLSVDFHLRHTHGTFYYQRKDRLELEGSSRSVIPAPLPLPAITSLAPVLEGADSWVDAIRGAAERIRVLADAPRPWLTDEDRAAEVEKPRWSLRVALDLLEREKFAEALELVRTLPLESARDPDALLLHAVLLTHAGHLELAEAACRQLLEVDALNAGAEYLLALCREGAGDTQGAMSHDQVALYLDPGFAMPRLHLGLLARRAGDRETAVREFGRALALLQSEDASRLLLFGGGFGREALIALCRTELPVREGKP